MCIRPRMCCEAVIRHPVVISGSQTRGRCRTWTDPTADTWACHWTISADMLKSVVDLPARFTRLHSWNLLPTQLTLKRSTTKTHEGLKRLKERIAVNETSPVTELRDVTCHMASHLPPDTSNNPSQLCSQGLEIG